MDLAERYERWRKRSNQVPVNVHEDASTSDYSAQSAEVSAGRMDVSCQCNFDMGIEIKTFKFV